MTIKWTRDRFDVHRWASEDGKFSVVEMYDHYPYGVVAWTPRDETIHRDRSSAMRHCEEQVA